MKIIESIDELKVGDKLEVVNKTKSYNEYGVVYLVVKDIYYTARRIRVSIVDYKGKELTWTYYDIPHSHLVLKFYEGSN